MHIDHDTVNHIVQLVNGGTSVDRPALGWEINKFNEDVHSTGIVLDALMEIMNNKQEAFIASVRNSMQHKRSWLRQFCIDNPHSKDLVKHYFDRLEELDAILYRI